MRKKNTHTKKKRVERQSLTHLLLVFKMIEKKNT